MSNEISARPSALPRSRNTRARQVGERLQQMARQLGAGAKLPAVPELRRDLGVSMTALGAALAELEARGIIERRNGVGTLVTERVTELVPRTLALVVSPRTLGAGHAPFWDFLVKTLEGHAHESGDKIEFHFALASAPQSAESGRACLQRGLVEGVESGAIAGAFLINTPRAGAEWIEAQGVPTVTYAGPGPFGVSHDRPEFLRRGLMALADAGCRRIGFWGVPELWHGNPATLDATDDFIASEICPHLPAFIEVLPTQKATEGDEVSLREVGWQLAQSVFGGNNKAPRPDGILIDNDMVTRGALVALRQLEQYVGSAVKVASHSNKHTDVLADYHDVLLRLEYDPAHIVDRMFETLQSRWRGEPVPARSYVTPTLIPTSGSSSSRNF